MSARPLSRRARTAVSVALLAWVVLLAVVLLAPSSAGPDWVIYQLADLLRDRGLPEVLTHPGRIESVLNVLAFVPVSLLGSLLWTRPTWRDWTAGGFVLSFTVEAVQAVGGDLARTVMVGDADTDAGAARSAGTPLILVDFGYSEIPAAALAPDVLLHHFDDLPAACAGLLGSP